MNEATLSRLLTVIFQVNCTDILVSDKNVQSARIGGLINPITAVIKTKMSSWTVYLGRI